MARCDNYLTDIAEVGFFGVAIYNCKNWPNVGTLLRTTHILGGSFISVIGPRYRKTGPDVLDTTRSVPLYEHDSFESFFASIPKGCRLIGVEMGDGAELLDDFVHPDRAVYLFGAEDHGLPQRILDKCHMVIKLQGKHSLNVSVTGSIVVYHRKMQRR